MGVKRMLLIFAGVAITVSLAFSCAQTEMEDTAAMKDTGEGHRLMVLDPGHFHAALVFKRSGYEGISDMVDVYAPVSSDYVDHMARVVPFNTRADNPASWRYKSYCAPDFLEAMLRDKPGDIVVISGKNDQKMDRIAACVENGLNTLVDKPWIIDHTKFPLLKSVLDNASQKGVVAYDIMTERYEITTILQKLIVEDENLFGTVEKGTPDNPAVIKSSVHHLFKYVAGRALKRPWWFFDTSVQGEGLVDITTHLVDLVFWTLFNGQPIDYQNDIEMVNAFRWPTVLTPEQFESITGSQQFPGSFDVKDDGSYPYYCNGNTTFTVNGVTAKVEVIWNYKAPEGTGDTHYSIIRGTKAHVLVLQGEEQKFRPEVYVETAPGADRAALSDALKAFVDGLASGDYSGFSLVEDGNRWRIDIPDSYRVGHEAHFGQVTDRFLEYLGGEEMPVWENANMLAKYYVTTSALDMAEERR